ncbi:MAG: Asp-tRNA(Asn)/Glu-tRNA(Gln) amidotransferase subunit GatA [Planctomycetes bacterium]|nr:Asp-tRNA(Asn)/Glu-tRNA(Gln) amidotransferase subunit GatA [Planctomycetota bacterium]
MSRQASATAIAAAVNAGASATIEVERALAAASADRLNAVIRVHRDRALAAARAVDVRVKAGERLPLAGVPLAVKDNLCVLGIETTACSKILKGYVAPYTATAVARLERAGAVVVASTNMDEFAMGSSNETSALGPVKNPLDEGRIPGGSSGGSAAAVAGGIVPLALGSDTGGSIRQPAALCGCVGLKPTYGMISRYGLIAFGSSLDQIGPLATSVADCAAALAVMAGADERDSTCATRDHGDLAGIAGDVRDARDAKGLRIGYVAAHAQGLQPAVAARLEAAKDALARAGATLVPVELPNERYAIAVYYVLATGEASSNLSRFDGVRFGHRTKDPQSLHELYARSRGEGFGPEVKRRIMLGTYVLSSGYYDAYYKKAQQVRRLICDDYARVFSQCDALLGPTSPTTAFARGEKLSDPLQMYLSDIFTIATNLAGVPGISVPFGADERGLAVGLQVQAAQWAEPMLLRVARALEALAPAAAAGVR